MSISAALANALSGLTVASRGVEVVSTNLAGAASEGFAPRDLVIGNRILGNQGAGARVISIERQVDHALLGARRVAQASTSGADSLAVFYGRIEDAIGDPDSAGSLGTRIAALETSLLAATSRPDVDARLEEAAAAAEDLVQGIRTLARELQDSRQAAEATILRDVRALRDNLAIVDNLNTAILETTSAGRDPNALIDQRQAAIDQIATIVPLREIARPNGAVALYTTGGAGLLDGRVASIDFQPSGFITADMTLAGGSLSPLQLDGVPMDMGTGSLLGGGSLQAAFAIRDDHAPTLQERLDSFSAELIARFESPAIDPTLPAGQPGLFTDAGNVFSPAALVGLSSRIGTNAAIDPASGGSPRALRDGLYATAPSEAGRSDILRALAASLASPAPLSFGPAAGQQRSISGAASDLLSAVSVRRLSAERDQTTLATQRDSLDEQLLAEGVDTDAEMQKLLLIEQSYAANARVIQVVGGLFDRLMEI